MSTAAATEPRQPAATVIHRIEVRARRGHLGRKGQEKARNDPISPET
jgi:hypothetical protein